MKRDLTARLREIVKQSPSPAAPVRELTYEPDIGATPRQDLTEAAAALGGTWLDGDQGTHCVVIDMFYEASRSHGRWPIEHARPSAEHPLHWLDPEAACGSDWSSKPVFFDTETTGLSGGAGTIAFLTGCGWFEADGFRVRQWLLVSQAGEPAMLRALGRVVDDTTLLVSYNGRSFDVPLMDMRWAFHRQSNPFDDVPHFDMLPTARRLWSRRETAFDGPASGDTSSCSLSTLERDVLGFHRIGDVPGFEIPARYFQFLRSGDGALLSGVLDHHRHDIVSLAVLMAHALRLTHHGPDLCRDDHEVVALGRLYERIGQEDRARAALERAALSADRYVRAHAFSRLGLMHRRAGRHDEAAAAWRGVLEAAGGRRSLFPLERMATEALAIHLEHRAQDLDEARKYAESLRRQATGRSASEVAHRLARLERKQQQAKKEGGPKAASLLDKP
jgi:uncharacterized protein YprB with RNaseH-like and TPR domain